MKILCQIFLFLISVHLAWDASVSEEVTGYKLHYGTVTNTYPTTINVGNVLNFTIVVDETNPIFFAVTAYDANGNESAYSTELEASVISKQVIGKGIVLIKQSDWSEYRSAQSIVVEKGTGKQAIITSSALDNYHLSAIKDNSTWNPPLDPYELSPSQHLHTIKVVFQKGHSLSGVEWIK